ncbi:saccharopine dehydrogenase NADP-binding domain-containing protein [Brochothrix thermosphacta]|uniref:saccharopine dehydrogenase NADP-binding domain-containing protein n=1 Tax=Brochothrix thermosphacta TaxID=2756 RepID=UPI003F954EA9
MTKNKIMLIGGHGHVGRIITKNLAPHFPEQLIIAGRNRRTMEQFVADSQLPLQVTEFDITQPIDDTLFTDVKLVVVCIDQVTTDFVSYCNNAGIDYIDVTANTAFYKQLAVLPLTEKSAVVYSVGLAPGLTNLMLAKLYENAPSFQRADIKVQLGLADAHGDAAIDWTLNQLNETYTLRGEKNPLKTFSKRRLLELGKTKQPVYLFNFSDQHTLRDQFPNRRITTYLGFDSRVVTGLMHQMQKWRLLPLLNRPFIFKSVKKMMTAKVIGSDAFYAQVATYDKNDQLLQQLTVTGHNEARATGLIAAFLIKKVYATKDPAGFVQIDHYCSFDDVVEAIPELTVL